MRGRTSGVRDRSLERAFLGRAERLAPSGAPGYAAAVLARLEDRGRERGDGFYDRPLVDLLTELRGEALDVGGWAALALQVLDVAGLAPAARGRLEDALEALATLGAEASAVAGTALGAAAVPPGSAG